MADNAIIYPDMVVAAFWLPEDQREKFLTACTLYRSAGVEPDEPKAPGAKAAWYAMFLVCKPRFDASRKYQEAGRRGGKQRVLNLYGEDE